MWHITSIKSAKDIRGDNTLTADTMTEFSYGWNYDQHLTWAIRVANECLLNKSGWVKESNIILFKKGFMTDGVLDFSWTIKKFICSLIWLRGSEQQSYLSLLLCV